MFDYVVTCYSPVPDFTLTPEPSPRGRYRRDVFDSHSIVLDLPADHEALRRTRRNRFWKDLRRRRRRFEEAHGPWRFSVHVEPDEVALALPRVRRVYRDRWAGRATSLGWETDAGFAPASRALLGLAVEGHVAVALLEAGGRPLAFSILLLQPPWCYAWQHAASPDPELRPYSLGTQLDVETFDWLITHRPDLVHYDFMLGDDAYKLAWASWRRPVYRRFEQPATPVGIARVELAAAAHRVRLLIRRHPGLHLRLQQLRHRAGPGRLPAERAVPRLAADQVMAPQGRRP